MKNQIRIVLGFIGLTALFLVYQNFASSDLNSLIDEGMKDQSQAQIDVNKRQAASRLPASQNKMISDAGPETINVNNSKIVGHESKDFKTDAERKKFRRISKEVDLAK
jgi:hypothetical protein